jgi:RNA polymerase sigma-70 factor (ECF subfamily)
VLKLRSGDDAAAALLEELYREPLLRFARGYLGAQDAEDAVQDILCTVLAAETVPDDFRVWIYTVTRRRCLNLLRGRGRRRDAAPLPERIDLPGTLRGQLTRLTEAERGRRVQEALAALPEAQREVLRLRYTEQLSRAEIARVLDVPEARVKSRLYEAMKKLREHPSLAGD